MCGCSKQVSGIDSTDNFAPVVKLITVCMFIAITVMHRMSVHQLDVESAFNYAPLHMRMYIYTLTMPLTFHLVFV